MPSGARTLQRRERALGVIGALLVVCTVGLPTTAVTRADPTHGVVTVRANVRLAPSLQSPIAAVLPAGAPVVMLEEQGVWYRIRTAAGLDAWVSQSLVRFDAEPQGPHASPADTATIRPLEGQPLSGVIAPDPIPVDPPGLPHAANGALFQSGCGGLMVAFVLVLVSAIRLQLRAARQFKWVTGELGAMLEVVEALSTAAAAACTREHSKAILSPRERAEIEVSDVSGGGPGGGAGKRPSGSGFAQDAAHGGP